jgi:uncharacterized protein (TIGR02444 family)
MEPALDNPFWAFSLKVYDAPGVAEECLKMQERLGLDVNVLLFAAHLGAAEGVMLAADEVAAAEAVVAAWHAETVRGLRALRRALKPASLDESNPLQAATVALRGQVKTAELEAEKIEQAMLWHWKQEHLTSHKRADARAALHSNLDEVLAHYGEPAGSADAELPHLQAAALVFA